LKAREAFCTPKPPIKNHLDTLNAYSLRVGQHIYKATTITNINKEVDVKAAEKMAKLHDILSDHGYTGHVLEVYLVRLLFCLFADDTGIFEKNIFFDYINNSKEDGSDLSTRMARLFELLDTPQVERDKQTMLPEELKRFAYIDGTLFEERLPFADLV